MTSPSKLSSSKKRQIEQLLERATRAMAAGRLGACEQLCETIENIQSGNADVANLRAFISVQNGDWERAIQLLEQAVEAEPSRHQFHHNLGKLYLQQKLYAKAAEHYREALRRNDKAADIKIGYSSCLLGLGKADEALSLLEQVSGKEQRTSDLLMVLGQSLRDLERYDEALDMLNKAIAKDPNYWHGHFEKGLTLMKLGDMEGALEEFRTTLSLNPDHVKAHGTIALIKEFASPDDPDLQAMESRYAVTEPDSEDRIHMCFALGKVYEALEQFDKAFRLYEEGNALHLKQTDYNPDADLAHLQAITKFYTPEVLRRTSSLEDDRPIFILGMPRCGSTLVEQILAAHPDVCSRGECSAFEKLLADLESPNKKLILEELTAFQPEEWRKIGLDYLRRVDQGTPAGRITDKTLENFRLVGAIHCALPKARIVHVRRQPLDNCMAIYKVHFQNRRLAYGDDLVSLGNFYRMYQQVMQHWREVLPTGVMYELDYEQLVADQEGETRKLLEACGLEWDDACLNFNKKRRHVDTASLAQIRRPIYSDSVARWKRFEPHLQPLIDILGDDSSPS